MNANKHRILTLLRQANELSEYMAELMAKMTAICDGLRKEGIV